ncbi:MAG: hypothetical protein KGK10_10035 [Rhodospirillales bacterium]|nr:hypothetical protein [Rhodospirillales bacterium]
MVPGLHAETEASLLAALDPAVTALGANSYDDCPIALFAPGDGEIRALGIEAKGDPGLTIVVTDPERPVGRVQVSSWGHDNVLFFDNRSAGGQLYANIRMLGSDAAVLFGAIGNAYVSLGDVFLRSDRQFLLWGEGGSAVGCSMEIEGTGQGMVIGDDALISAGVWIRNHDMHAMHDIATGRRIGRDPVNTILERHVWLGQDALLQGVTRVGMGSIVGARALVKGSVPRFAAVAGVPARVLREGVSWGRETYGMTEAERVLLGLPPLADG